MDPVRKASEQAAALGGPRIKSGEPWSQLGGPQSQLGGPQSQLREPRSQLGGPQSQVGGPGGTEKKEREKNRAFTVCGGTIGHRPLRGRCPKKISLAKEKKSQNRGFLIKWVSALSEAFILFSLILSNLNNDNNNSKNNNNNKNNNDKNTKATTTIDKFMTNITSKRSA